MKLSIIIPAYNEEKTIPTVLEKLDSIKIPGVTKEIIVVDDGSTDASASVISKFKSNFKFIQHKKNQGKGAAVRTGIKNSTGDYILIQDADLEYNPQDITKLVKPILNKSAQVVYGTRLSRMPNFSRDERTLRFFAHYLGNKFLSLVTSFLYGKWVTDMETGYKLFPKKAVENIKLNSRSFNFEPEITSKLLKQGYKILEIPISTNPRGYEEGKKLNTFRDGTIALLTLLKYRFLD
ncbi:MAG: glycosyltransferase family 2 protein [Candidatus Levybacteria bacterium]|nr:glycosyltransferase family 2 protein [Candidatus Levybacteria bacterium]